MWGFWEMLKRDYSPAARLARQLNDEGYALVFECPTEAKPLFERALAINEALFGPGHEVVATNLRGLGTALYKTGELERAKSVLERAIAIDEIVSGPNDLAVGNSLAVLGLVLKKMGKYEEAAAVTRRDIAIDERWFGEEDKWIAEEAKEELREIEYLGRVKEAPAKEIGERGAA